MKLLKNKQLMLGIVLVILLVFYILFRLKGVLFLIIFMMMILPIYLLLGLFKLKTEERAIFSFFIAIGIFSSLTYWLGFLFSSLKIAAIATFLLLIAYWFLFKNIYSPKKYKEEIILLSLILLVFIASFLIKAFAVSKLPVPQHASEYLECLKDNAKDYCGKLVMFKKF